MPRRRSRWSRCFSPKNRRYIPPAAVRDPGKKPKGAKDGWIGVVVERDDPDNRRSPGTMYVYGRQGYLGEFRTNENGFIGKSRVFLGATTRCSPSATAGKIGLRKPRPSQGRGSP
ncbi:MAG: hypothetical protein ACKOJB_01050 [Chthoniobacterales bacterium]